MKKIFFLMLLFLTGGAYAQDRMEERLTRALLDADTAVLANLLHADLAYGHSNGWIESRKELLQNISSGKMKYLEISNGAATENRTGEVLVLHHPSTIRYELDGKTGVIELFVVLVWVKHNDQWKLLVRQSTRINK